MGIRVLIAAAMCVDSSVAVGLGVGETVVPQAGVTTASTKKTSVDNPIRFFAFLPNIVPPLPLCFSTLPENSSTR